MESVKSICHNPKMTLWEYG